VTRKGPVPNPLILPLLLTLCLPDYPRGRATGGSSAINGMIYQTGNPGDYDSWLQPNFTARHMKRCFQTLNDLGWPCVPQKLSWSILDTFGQAVTDVFPNVFTSKKLVNSHSEAVGYFQVNQRNGLRGETSRAKHAVL